MTVRTRLHGKRLAYTGAELRAHFALDLLGIEGDSAISFLGPCDVRPEYMIDLIDLKAGARIRARLMLHFVIEHFDRDLGTAILRQRLFAAIARDLLQERARRNIERSGDDLYAGRRKVTISVATLSPVSSLVHFAFNVDPAGAPVAAVGLAELRVEPRAFARELLKRYAEEIRSIDAAAVTVRPAR